MSDNRELLKDWCKYVSFEIYELIAKDKLNLLATDEISDIYFRLAYIKDMLDK